MDLQSRLAISYYKEVAKINEKHQVSLVQHIVTKKFYVKKVLSVYNRSVYQTLLEHPVDGTPRIYALYEEEDQLTVIEELIQGATLEEILKESGSMTISQASSYVLSLSKIIRELHSFKPPIIHRDIKPSNLMVTSYGQIFLLDFNAAKFYSDDHNEDTVLLGTHGYAAPEQYGFGASSISTDIYALGMLLKTLVGDMDKVKDPLKTDFDRIVTTCTKLDARDRYVNVDELMNNLELLLYGNASGQPGSSLQKKAWYQLPGFRRRNPLFMIGAGLYYVLLFFLSFTLEDQVLIGIPLFIERFLLFIVGLTPAFICANYMGLQKHLPYCQHKNRLIRCMAVICNAAVITSIFFLILCAVVSFMLP